MQKGSDGGIKMKERTYVDDVDRSVYDIKDEENDAYRIKSGLDASIVIDGQVEGKFLDDNTYACIFRYDLAEAAKFDK